MDKAWKVLTIIALMVAVFFGGYGLIYAANNLRAVALEENITEKHDKLGDEGEASEVEGVETVEDPTNGQATTTSGKPKLPSRQKPNIQGDIRYIDVADLDKTLILVNKGWNLPRDYVPNDLVTVETDFVSYALPERRQMRAEAAEAMLVLMEAAKEEGLGLLCVSGYRSYGTQKVVFDNKVKAVGEEAALKYVAYPGQSEHQTGLAMDLTSRDLANGLTSSFADTAEGQWVAMNAHRFGFIIRYPAGKENITGYNYEPWHIRYVGQEVAQYIYEHGLTLEEYLEADESFLENEENKTEEIVENMTGEDIIEDDIAA